MSSISHLSAFYLKIKPTVAATEVKRRFETEQGTTTEMSDQLPEFKPVSTPPNAKQNIEATPKRWSGPHNVATIAFKLNSILDEPIPKIAPTPEQRPELDDSAKQKFINCLEDYCHEILESRRDQFVDLKDFKEQEFSVTLDELEEAKRNAERVAKVTDHAGFANVHVNDAIEAGVLAFAESQVLTRKRARLLQNNYKLEPNSLLYKGIPEKCVSKFANKVRTERDSRIVETYVDFKTELKAKHEVLERVEIIQKLDKLNELPALKRLRNRENTSDSDATRRSSRSTNSADFKTPPSALKRKFNPLDYNNLIDGFLDEQAREFVDENKLLAKRRKSMIPAQIFD